MTHRNISRARQSAIALATILFVGACGDARDAAPDDEPAVSVPLGAALPPLAMVLTPTYEPRPGLNPPERVDGHLYLRVDQDGAVAGALSAGVSTFAFLTPVTGHVDGEVITLAAGQVDYAAGRSIQWDELELRLLDRDGDREADGASGDARGTWHEVQGDVVYSTHYTTSIAASRDTASSTADFVKDGSLRPFDGVDIELAEPVRRDRLEASLRVLAGGVAVAGTFEDTPVDGLITRTRFQPADFLPFDQPLTLDVAQLRDPSGNAITAGPSRLHVEADLGAATGNLGFERALTRWIVFGGEADEAGSFAGIDPAEGSHQAVIHSFGSLAAYIDVPADASTLHVSIARVSLLEEVAPDYTAVVALHRAGGETIVGFDAQDLDDGAVVACTTCGSEFRYQLGPVTRDIDLAALRGERVWLTLEARAFYFIGVPALAVLVDDLRITTSN